MVSNAEQRKLDAQKRQQQTAQTRPLKRELEQNEQRMASIEAEKVALEQQLSAPMSPADIAQAGRRLKSLTDEAAKLEEFQSQLELLRSALSSFALEASIRPDQIGRAHV